MRLPGAKQRGWLVGIPRTHRRRRGTAFVLALVALLVMSVAGTASAANPGEETLVPIGGGYTTASLKGFAQIVIDHASGDSVDILVNPSSYGNDPADLAENTALAQSRTNQIEAACEAIVDTGVFSGGCTATLLHLFMRSQTDGPEGTAAVDLLEDSNTDGVYILGGDQGIAMEVLANSDVEDAMADAYANGVVFGGTSAGAAVESVDMINGYTDPGWPYNALEKDKVIVWWANDQTGPDDFTRGLSFSSENAITDQHFFERGRFGRLLNVVAQSDERYDESKVGVGIDYATGVQITDDTTVHNVFGDSAVAIIDGESGATFTWVPDEEDGTLSARNIVTHIMAAGDDVSYDLVSREVLVDDVVDELDYDGAGSMSYDGNATLVLGGDLLMDPSGPAMQAFVSEVQGAAQSGRVVVVSGGSAKPYGGQQLAQSYVKAMQDAGLSKKAYTFETVPFNKANATQASIDKVKVDDAVAVVFAVTDQAQVGTLLDDTRFTSLLDSAIENADVVLTDGAVTAAMGDVYVSTPNPTDDNYQDVGIEAFQEGGVTFAEGLGIVSGAAFQGRNTYDQHWGRLYALSMESPETMVYGISEMTAIVIDADDATVVGERSVIALDGSQATFIGDNGGAFSALNVIMDLYAPGDTIE